MPNGFVQGTTHITYVKKKGKSRNRRNCIYYNSDGSCGTASQCSGSTHCSLYITEEDYQEKKRRELIQKEKQEMKKKKEQRKKSKRG